MAGAELGFPLVQHWQEGRADQVRAVELTERGVSGGFALQQHFGDAVADLRNITYRTFRKILRRNAAYVAEQSVPGRLAGLGVPMLVIFGAADPRYEPSSAYQYDAVPNARVEMLPSVGHVPMLEAPEATSELLLGFTATAADIPPVIPTA